MDADLLRRAAARLREDIDGSSPARHLELMHPPVVLAVANLLTCMATMPSASDPADFKVAERLAREILREPADG